MELSNNLNDCGVKPTYDASTRLIKVQRHSVTGTADTWPVIATYAYDGLGRRIAKKVQNSGDRNTGDEDRNDTQ